MTDDTHQPERTEFGRVDEVALQVEWFADLASGDGAAAAVSPALRAALQLATVDRAREIVMAIRAERERQERLEQKRLHNVERNRQLAVRSAFEKRVASIAWPSAFADVTPAGLILGGQNGWQRFAALFEQSFSEFVEWLVEQVGQARCDVFLARIPVPHDPDRVAAEFAVEFGDPAVAIFDGFAVDAISLAEIASRTASLSPRAKVPGISALFRSGSLSAFARIESTGLVGTSERWEQGVVEWGTLTGSRYPPDGRTLARILHPLLDLDAARSLTARALALLPHGAIDVQLAGLVGRSSVADLAILHAVGSVEAARLAPIRRELLTYNFNATLVSYVRSLDDVAEVLAQDWERALIFLSSERYEILKKFLPNATALPERPRRGPSRDGPDMPEWDALLIQVLHQLSPSMPSTAPRPRRSMR